MRHRTCWDGEIGSPKCSGASFQSHPCEVLPCVDHNKKVSNSAYEAQLNFKTVNNNNANDNANDNLSDKQHEFDSYVGSGSSFPEDHLEFLESVGLSPDSAINTSSD